MNPTWVRILLSCPRRITPLIDGNEAHRHDHDHGERQRQAFELRREHQEDEHHGEHEGEHRGIAGPDLLEGERRPFVAEAVGQRLGGELLHDLDRLPLRIAGRGAPSSSAAE